MSIGVRQAAERLGVSRQRVLAMIKSGSLRAVREGRDWRIDPADLPKQPNQSRALSARMAWSLVELSADSPSLNLASSERKRLIEYWNRLGNSEHPAHLLRSWMRSRAQRRCFQARDLDYLRDDERLMPSGLSSPLAGLSGAHQVEGYVLAEDIDRLVLDHMLVESSPANSNVVLHVVSQMRYRDNAPALLVAADLADHHNRFGREDEQVRELINAVWHER